VMDSVVDPKLLISFNINLPIILVIIGPDLPLVHSIK
jgi:hypothetical protein